MQAYDKILRGNVECALWSSSDTDDDCEYLDQKYSISDIAPDTLAAMRADRSRFYDQYWEQVNAFMHATGRDLEHVGHDFWLTRNGHGAGFWDRDGAGDIGRALTDAVGWGTDYPEVELYVGDDGKIYHA